MELKLNFEAQNLNANIKLLEECLNLYPYNNTKLQLSRLYWTVREMGRLDELLLSFDNIENLNISDTVILCGLLLERGFWDKGMMFLYKMRKNNSTDVEAHKNFIRVSSKYNPVDTGWMYPKEKNTNSAVTLTKGDDNKTFIIGEDMNNINDWLLNVKVGDSITASGVMHKYVYAYRDSLEKIATSFPEQSDFIVSEIDNNATPKEVFSQINQLAEKLSIGNKEY